MHVLTRELLTWPLTVTAGPIRSVVVPGQMLLVVIVIMLVHTVVVIQKSLDRWRDGGKGRGDGSNILLVICGAEPDCTRKIVGFSS